LRKLYILIITLIVLVGMVYISSLLDKDGNDLSNKIIRYIDNNTGESNSLIFNMNEITDFNWDKLLIYGVGSSSSEISNALGIEYNESTDLVSGMVFVYDDKIVYKEQIPYNPEKPEKLLLYVGMMYGQPNYRFFTSDNAIFEGSRRESKGKYFYEIAPFEVD